MSDFEDRHSKADPTELITDPEEKARKEAENGVRQFKAAIDVIGSYALDASKVFRLRQSIVLDIHQKALNGIHPLAGTYRNTAVTIGKSQHTPPSHLEVPDLVAEMCDYVNDYWNGKDAVELAAYVLWRMNWIHPFADGNGRTARVLSYVVLSVKLRSILPGAPSIPDQIAADKGPYYLALEEADESWKRGIVALSNMEAMLSRMLAAQLLAATQEAGA